MTVSHNKGGMYMRSRTVPTNPNTPAQADARAVVATLAQAWQGLTEVQRTQWEDFTISNPVVDVLGSTIQLSGEQMFIRCNQRLELYGFTQILVPPLTMGVDPVDDAGFTVDSGPPFAVTLDATAPTLVYVRMTPPISAGIANFAKYLRTLGVFEATTLDADVTAAYAARFGAPSPIVVGKKVGMEIAGFGELNGQISVPLVSFAIIT